MPAIKSAAQAPPYDIVPLAGGYLMINSIRIDNFRCFKHAEINALKRINVVVGSNGGGKTTLLEALFVAGGGSPELALRVRNFRGMGRTLEVSDDGMESIWKNLFHKFDLSQPVSVKLLASDQKSRQLTISSGDSELMDLPLQPVKGFRIGKAPRQASPNITRGIEFTWIDGQGNSFKSRPSIVDDKLRFPQHRSENQTVFIPSSFRLSPEESAKRLSSLSRRNASHDLADVLASVYPDVQGISVENNDGNWEVFVQSTKLEERIPIGLHSSGSSRLVAMMLAITAAENGVVLIDEIENGFYYQKLPEIWRVLTNLAESFSCQMFVSTHSRECIQALAPLVETDPELFTLLNVEPSDDGVSSVTMSQGDVMGAAIQSGFEIR